MRSIGQVLGKPNNLPQKIRAKCLRTSWSICGLQALLPKSLQIQLFYDPHNDPAVSSGTADTWKGQHLGQDVAVRALRVYKTDDPGQIRKVSSLPLFGIINKPTVSCTGVLQGGCDMEEP